MTTNRKKLNDLETEDLDYFPKFFLILESKTVFKKEGGGKRGLGKLQS